jgi:hypothetical protein
MMLGRRSVLAIGLGAVVAFATAGCGDDGRISDAAFARMGTAERVKRWMELTPAQRRQAQADLDAGNAALDGQIGVQRWQAGQQRSVASSAERARQANETSRRIQEAERAVIKADGAVANSRRNRP